jgi:hypothetical protein
MRRNVKKSLWMSQEELWDLKEKAQAACLTESEFIRQRIAGYTPPQKVDDRFWKAMDIMREFVETYHQPIGTMECHDRTIKPVAIDNARERLDPRGVDAVRSPSTASRKA